MLTALTYVEQHPGDQNAEHQSHLSCACNSLRYSPLGEFGAAVLAERVADNTVLCSLHLEGAKLPPKAIKTLGPALCYTKSLHTLRYVHGAVATAKAIVMHVCLCYQPAEELSWITSNGRPCTLPAMEPHAHMPRVG